jgi:tetratricopeptide (TPR) repeat protein
LDDSLAQAHATLGFCLWSYDWNWAAGEDELKKAISLDPRYATAHHWYGLLLMALGRTDEANKQIQQAREIDPFSAVIQQGLASVLLFARQYDRAIEEGLKAQSSAGAHAAVAQAFAAKDMREQAVSEYQKGADLLPPGNRDRLYYSALAQALAGREAEARTAIEEMKALAGERYVSPLYIAGIFNRLGRKDETFEWLEKGYADHSFFLVYLKVHPSWDPVRSDPRFTDLLRRLDLAGDGRN